MNEVAAVVRIKKKVAAAVSTPCTGGTTLEKKRFVISHALSPAKLRRAAKRPAGGGSRMVEGSRPGGAFFATSRT